MDKNSIDKKKRNSLSYFAREGILESNSQSRTNENRSNQHYRVVSESNINNATENKKLLSGSTEEESFTPVLANPFAPSDNKQELSTTFMHMEYRKLKRASSGSYRDKPRGSLWTVAYGSVFATYITYQFIIMQQDQSRYLVL